MAKNLYEVRLHHGKCPKDKFAIIFAKDEEGAKKKTEGIHVGYKATEVREVTQG